MNIIHLQESICYYPDTGFCLWRFRPRHQFGSDRAWRSWNVRFAGKAVGYEWKCSHGKMYMRFSFQGTSWSLHRAIFAIVTGRLPESVDHKDGNGLNNRWDNLRDTTPKGNSLNMRRHEGKKLPTGIVVQKNRFIARIGVDYKLVYLGMFRNLEDAVSARRAAEIKHGFHENHGTVRPR